MRQKEEHRTEVESRTTQISSTFVPSLCELGMFVCATVWCSPPLGGPCPCLLLGEYGLRSYTIKLREGRERA